MAAVELWDLIAKGGLPVLLAVIIYAGYKEMWVWGRLYRDRTAALERERDEWKALALKTTGLGEKALDVAQSTTRRRSAP